MPADPRVIKALRAAGVAFEEIPCDPELADTAKFCEAYGIPLEQSANAIVVASRKPTGLSAMCLVLAHTRLDVNGLVRRRLGARKVSFAPPELTVELTGQEIGGVTAFGLSQDIPIWVDGHVLEPEWVVIGAGSRTAKIKLNPEVFRSLDRFEVVEGLARLTEPSV